jgi:hypothetical protein
VIFGSGIAQRAALSNAQMANMVELGDLAEDLLPSKPANPEAAGNILELPGRILDSLTGVTLLY